MTTSRPKQRKMPTWKRIVDYHGYGRPHCVKCRRSAEQWSDLIRAHVIDRWADGLDAPQNIRPLCDMCHRHQPVFKNGDEQVALEWFNTPGDAVVEMIELAMEHHYGSNWLRKMCDEYQKTEAQVRAGILEVAHERRVGRL